MNNNFLLESAIKNNKVSMKDNDIIIDELFQLLESRVSKDNYIVIKIFTPLNYANTDQIYSHNSSQGKHFYIRKNKIIRFMLYPKKNIENIDKKHDNLRKAIYRKR